VMRNAAESPGSLDRLGFVCANAAGIPGVFLITFIVLFLGMTRIPNLYDESIVLTGATRVLAGQVIHRDFYANYGPGQFHFDCRPIPDFR